LLRLAFCAGLVGLVFLGMNIVRPDVLEEMGLDFWEWPHLQQCYNAELDRDHNLDEGLEHSMNRYRAKNEICRNLIAGRISLKEAGQRFSELPAPPPHMWEGIQGNYASRDKHECMCRHVMEWACEMLGDQPGVAEALRCRLEAEFWAK
jgi:hypothetical protein